MNTTKKDIDLTHTEQYMLSIRLSPDGFSFAVHPKEEKNVMFFRHTPVNVQRSMAANVKSFLAQTPELNAEYYQTNILIHTLRYTTVPLELFEDELMETIFYQNLPMRNNEIVLCNILGNSNVVVLFSIDKLTHVFLSERFPRIRFFATVSSQLEYLTLLSKQKGGRKIYANLHTDNMEVFCFEYGKLQLANTYPVNNNEDRSYYLLNLWKQLEYDAEQDELHLTGASQEERNELIGFLRQFILKIFIINPRTGTSDASESMSEDIPFDIQSLLICE